MSGASSQDPRPEVPEEFSEAYRRAYQRSLAEHPTEMMLQARPGKRAAEPTGLSARISAGVAEAMLRPGVRIAVGAVGATVLILLAFVAGRLAS